MKRLCPLLMLILLATSCTSPRTPTPALVPTPTAPNMTLVAWVDNPAPEPGSTVTVHFQLLNEGVSIEGLDMITMWSQGGHNELRHATVQYDIGQCAIVVSDMQVGVYVPVTVTTQYIGWTFFGYTGFTPR